MKIKLILSIIIMSSFSLSSAMSETPDQMLYRALKTGDFGIKLAEKAIKLGANVNITYKEILNYGSFMEYEISLSPLMFLIKKLQSGHKIKKSVQLLLESGADIGIRNQYNYNNEKRTVLDFAKEALKNFLSSPIFRETEITSSLEDIINFIQNNEVISKEKAEKLKKEINEHLIPDISDMIIQYTYLVKKEFKKDSDKEVSFLSI